MNKATIEGTLPCYLGYVPFRNAQGQITDVDYYLYGEIGNQYIAHVGRVESKGDGFVIPGQEIVYPTFEKAGQELYRSDTQCRAFIERIDSIVDWTQEKPVLTKEVVKQIYAVRQEVEKI